MRGVALTLAVALVLAVCAGAGCSGGQVSNSGVTEPIQVSGAQFIPGALPGAPPPDGGKTSQGAEAGADGGGPRYPPLTVTTVTFSNAFIVSGFAGTNVSGFATSDAIAVGVQLAGKGTGYWVLPTQGEDVQFPGTRDFGFAVSFNHADAAGNTALRVVAIGANGQGGAQIDAPICIESRVPDNGHACEPTKPVPAAVFSLTWDAPFDVDLTVITPGGRNVNPKTDPTTAPIDGGGPLPSAESVGLYDGETGVIDRDSMGECVVDAWREEDLVFQDYPPTGTYWIYANPYASCGVSSVRFTLTLWEPDPHAKNGGLVATYTQSGELLASQTTGGTTEDGGSAAGLFVAQKVFE